MTSVSLQDCLELFTQEETLEGDERPVNVVFPLVVLYPLRVVEHSSSCCCSYLNEGHYYCVYLYMLCQLMY